MTLEEIIKIVGNGGLASAFLALAVVNYLLTARIEALTRTFSEQMNRVNNAMLEMLLFWSGRSDKDEQAKIYKIFERFAETKRADD